MRNQRYGMAMAARIAANHTYEQAIQTREHLDTLMSAIPVDNPDQYKRVQDAQELAVQSINASWKAKVAAEEIEMELGKE